jgi:hypothetical protein
MRRVVWFSCGAASAAAAKLAVEAYGSAVEVVYCNTLVAEHPDNARFLSDVERWLERHITILRSTKYRSPDEVFDATRYMSGPHGARCTVELKKIPREVWQRPDDTHLFGYTLEEQDRADNFEANNPALAVEWILIDRHVRKADCLRMLREAGIELPAMYALGFEHNNCLGCVKASSPRYWNQIRRHFPEVFARRAQQSRLLGVKLVRLGEERVDGKRKVIRCFLDELAHDTDGPSEQIECGPVCQQPLDFGEAL